jgi:hypothetical protein
MVVGKTGQYGEQIVGERDGRGLRRRALGDFIVFAGYHGNPVGKR